MADKRMFSKKIIDSDAFLDMPLSTQALYFHLSMRADDEGFVDKPKSIMRTVRANDDDFKILMAKRFVIPFESGICVIKHWGINNYIQNDRFTPTVYQEERSMLEIKENKAYTECIHNGYKVDTQVSIGKVSIDKIRLEENKEYGGKPATSHKQNSFIKPTIEEIKAYNNEIDAEAFWNFYESKGWLIGKNKMVSWHSAVANWLKRDDERKPKEVRDAKAKERQYDKELESMINDREKQ